MLRRLKMKLVEYHQLYKPLLVPTYMILVALSLFSLSTRIFSSKNDNYNTFNNTKQPFIEFSKYNKLKNNYDEVVQGLDAALDNNQNVTLVIIKTGCPDCKKWEGELTHYYYQSSHIKDNRTKYLMVDIAGLSDEQLKWFVKNLPMQTVYPSIKTPTVMNIKPMKTHWVLQDAFIEKGTSHEMKEIFKNSIS